MTYKPKIVYIKGKDMHVADSTSWDCNPTTMNYAKCERDVEVMILSVIQPQHNLSRVREENRKNSTIQDLIQIINHGWPTSKSSFVTTVIIWLLMIVIYKRNQVLLPSTIRYNIMKILHTGHQGIQSRYQQERSFIMAKHACRTYRIWQRMFCLSISEWVRTRSL